MEIAMQTLRVIFRSKAIKLCLTLFIFCAIYCFYNCRNSSSFSDLTEKDHMPDISLKYKNGKHNDKPLLSVSKVLKEIEPIDVLITFTKADNNYNLKEKFKITVNSLFKFSTVPINLHILGDEKSESIAKDILASVAEGDQYKLVHLNVEDLAKQVHEIVSEMQKYFSYKPGAYYSDALFFISIAMHRVLPNLHKVILLDADLKFNADIKELFQLFNQFSEDNIMGIARDGQPVYRHNFYIYRNAHKGTRVGDPPPDGLTGFNSGVLLLDLDKMRQSSDYNELVKAESVKRLTEKYSFKGHLGDQDFFSLISLDYEKLFYVLPCNWNRQLCDWWRNNGYKEVFDQYYQCQGHINIYHGNCNTKIPKLDWENNFEEV